MLTASADITHSTYDANGSKYGEIALAISGGRAPYFLLWSDGQTSPTAVSLNSGIYTVRITDKIGASATFQYVVQDHLGVECDTVNPSAHGAMNGQITVRVYGGVLPYTLTWQDGAVGTTLRRLGAGYYEVQATDSSGMTGGKSVLLTEPAEEPSLEVPNLMVTDAIDLSQEGVLYFGNRAMRLRFDKVLGSVIIEKAVGDAWIRKLVI
jgi:hypothetical protein